MIVLDEGRVDPRIGKKPLVVSLREEAARVAMPLGRKDSHFRDFKRQELGHD
jgi:hypothetical protein